MLYFFISGCVLPEVLVLSLIQWITINTIQYTLHYGKDQNHVFLGYQLGIPAGQGNGQNHLKGSEGCDRNHQNPLSKDNVVL